MKGLTVRTAALLSAALAFMLVVLALRSVLGRAPAASQQHGAGSMVSAALLGGTPEAGAGTIVVCDALHADPATHLCLQNDRMIGEDATGRSTGFLTVPRTSGTVSLLRYDDSGHWLIQGAATLAQMAQDTVQSSGETAVPLAQLASLTIGAPGFQCDYAYGVSVRDDSGTVLTGSPFRQNCP